MPFAGLGFRPAASGRPGSANSEDCVRLFTGWSRKRPAARRSTENKGFSGLTGGSFVSFGLVLTALSTPAVLAQSPAPSEWSPAQVQAILDKTQTIRLSPSLAHLTAGERVAVGK